MIEQGSPEWFAARLGKATASRIADVVRKTKTGPSKDRERYLGELVAERLTGQTAQRYQSADMAWGSATEAEARAAYAFYTGHPVAAVGFVDHPEIAMSGASPDGLVGDDGLLEIKCPATHTHIATLLGAPIDADYLIQMQWQMACADRRWCDWVSYDPRLPEEMRLFVKRVERDNFKIKDLEKQVTDFLTEADSLVKALNAKYRRAAA